MRRAPDQTSIHAQRVRQAVEGRAEAGRPTGQVETGEFAVRSLANDAAGLALRSQGRFEDFTAETITGFGFWSGTWGGNLS